MTTHVFIVDARTFKYHLEYEFVGTGMKDSFVDFNDTPHTALKFQTENTLLGLIADFSRVRIGDLAIFYLQQQQNFSQGIVEGKFYGVFEIKSLVFLDNNDEKQFLKQELGKSLTFRCLIKPYNVYAKGVSEWEALDEIKNIHSPNQMLWSLIYRKLKGNRGNTMITIYESERLIKLVRDKNHREILQGQNFTFNKELQEIEVSQNKYSYKGRTDCINILPRLLKKYQKGNQFESHLQTYILQHLNEIEIFKNKNIEWIGNEVSCGVGMQRIDIMLSIDENPRIIIPIELKSICVYLGILHQMQRYIDWLEQYYIPNRPSDIQPIIICRKFDDKQSKPYQEFCNEVKNFNNKNNILPLSYMEFSIINEKIIFERVF